MGCGAGPGREPVAVGEPGDVSGVGQDPGCHDGPDAGQVHQGGAGGDHHLLEFLGEDLDLLLDRDQLSDLFRGESAAGLAGQVPRTHRSQDSLRLSSGDVLLALSRNELGQQPVYPVHCLDPGPAQLGAPVDQHPQRLQLDVIGQHPKLPGADRNYRHGVRVVGVGLAVVPGVEQPRPRGQLRRDVHDVLARRPAAAAPTDGRHRCCPRPPRFARDTRRRVCASRRTRPCRVRTAPSPAPSRGRRRLRWSPTACGDRPR